MKIETLFDVKGRIVAITGGASGIGLAFAEILSANGARVIILDIDEAGMEREAARLRAAGGDVGTQHLDLADRAAIYRAFEAVDRDYGKLDVLFANAGMDAGRGFLDLGGQRVEEGQIENFPDEAWDRVIAINLTGTMATIKAAVPLMRKAGGGRVIVTTSTASVTVNAVASLGYYPAKAGAAHLVRRLALELAGANILVNSIAPGGVATNIAGGMIKDPAFQKAVAPMIPLHRVAQPDDLKGLAVFLASPASAYITGTQFLVDGGTTLGPAD
jgi:NAD(P)-dependent dehydrogenase (short-subunit alcohol dehydrogenase family)